MNCNKFTNLSPNIKGTISAMGINMNFRFSFLIILFTCVFMSNLHAQEEENAPTTRFWNFGGNFGIIGWSPTTIHRETGTEHFVRVPSKGFGSLSDNQGRTYPSLLANTSMGVNAGHSWFFGDGNNFIGLYGEFQIRRCIYQFLPPFQYVYNGQLIGYWVEMDKYFLYSGGLQYGRYLNSNSVLGGDKFLYLRSTFGQSSFHRNGFTRIETGKTENWLNTSDTGFTTKTIRSNKNTYVMNFEFGFRQFNEDKTRSTEFAIMVYLPMSPSYVQEYEFFKHGNSVGKSEVIFQGSTIMLNARYNFGLPRKPKKEKVKRERNSNAIASHHKVNERDLDIQTSITTRDDSVVLEIYDRGMIDGDIVSVYLNGELILDNFTLAREKKKVTLHLEPGENYVVVVAENMGSQPPNTSAVDIDYGSKKKSVDVVSDKGKNGAIEIFYKPR